MNNRAGSFVGRRSEVEAIIDGLAVSGGARPIAPVCVVGPAGIGKTRCAAEVDRRLDADGVRVVWTRCWDGPGTPALWPWAQLLEQLGVESATGDIGRDRIAYFDRIVSELQGAADRPIVLVIDDLHWADAASLELLGFVARSPHPNRLSVLATYRKPEVTAGNVAQQIARIERESTVVTLSGLTVEQVAELATARGAELPRDLLEQLHERSAGNPFFVGELLHHLSDDPAGVSTVTTGLRVAIEGHLDLVDEPCRRVLETAAVQGRVFDERVLALAAGLEEFEVAESLHAAERFNIVTRDGIGWRFEHALLAEVLLARQGTHDVALHHARIADALEKINGPTHPDHVEPIANHLLASGSLTTPDRLLGAAVAAAHSAGLRLAWEDQSHHLATAAHALRSLGDPDPVQLVNILIERCEVDKQRRHLDAARRRCLEAAEIARSVDDPTLLARVALAFPPDTEAIEIDDIYDPAQRPLREEALAALAESGGHEALRAELQAALALSLYWETPTGDRAESHHLSAGRRDELTADAVRVARRLGDDRALAASLNARIYANWGPSMRSSRATLAEELVDTATRLGDAHLALSGRVWRIVELLETHRLDRAAREIDAYEREATRIRSRLHLWNVARWRATQAFMAGDLDATEALAGEALALGAEIMPDEVAFHFYTTTIGPVQYLRGTLDDSYELVSATAADSANVPAWRMGLATIAAETGRLDVARRELAALAADDFAMLPRDLNFVGTMVMCALVAHDLDDADVAAQVYQHLYPYAGRLALHGTGYASYGSIDLALGECAHVSGRPGTAQAHYEAAIEQLDPHGSPYALVARLRLGRLLAPLEPVAATGHLSVAVDGFERSGLDVMAGRALAAAENVTARSAVRFGRHGGGWLLQRGTGTSVELSSLKGFTALAALLTRPGESIHVVELAALIEGNRAPDTARLGSDELLDAQARRAYEQRVVELRNELDDADRRGAMGRSAELGEELDHLLAALQQARGFGGRSTRMRTDADRARVNVTKHIRRAIDRIDQADAELGEHLRGHVTTGMTCRYEGALSGVTWTIA